MIIKKKLVLISLILFIIILFIQNIFALTANSSSYSISMFGNKLVAANPSSISYDSTVLSEVQGTTRNAEADSYSTNVGFFSGTIPYKTVQISSYSIYPTSAVTGSIISFKVSAINAQSIWLKMTLPNSMEETINLTNNVYSYYTADLVGIYSITFYANSSTNSLTSVLDSFEITSPITSSSTGGGTSCKYIWDCGSWSICSPDGKQTRTCKNIGTCTGEEGKPIEERNCSEALFDVKLKLGQLELTTNESLAFNVNLIQTKSIEKIDVQIKYSIIDKNENEIYYEDSNGYRIERTYDSNGNVLTYKNSDGYSFECTYDSNGKILTFKNSDGYWSERTFDDNGNRLTYKDSEGVNIEY